MSNITVIARKEIGDAIRSRQMLLLVTFLSLAILISVWVASASFGLKMTDYNAYLSALTPQQRLQALTRPQLFPLTLLRSGIEYLEILGALFAFIIGFTSISRERSRGTSLLLLSRPITKREIILGKIFGLFAIWSVILAIIYAASVGAILTVGHGQLGAIDYARLLIAFVGADIYLLFWSIFAIAITSRMKQFASAILVGITSWLVVVLVIPQIGDTMDPDNQVPGGLFASLGILKSNEISILSHFHTFDVLRNGLEVTSITKLFERVAFAFLGVKDKYNQASLSTVARAFGTSIAAILILTILVGVITMMISKNEETLKRRSS
ncbi:MAG: ABC transporter permease subunit [Actinobacteria bacterium]|nr:ABC transporter permease subunit [Actinomycetota bacterium]